MEVEGLKFRKLVNVRNFISKLASDYDAKCGKLNKSENLMTVECSGSNAKLYFEIKTERIRKPKVEKKEKKESENKKSEESADKQQEEKKQ
ncbi:hypothetical protein DFR86_09960 [Acidianus sulfidivorans JP7]|uniref:Uncharacterized protein n=1 Tax=Acidianus sulfidivorans JP7 TaxID=619593 RepID=A0A2U9IQS1_9CREN|nr:hypothetical protein DFR86_09960 [Acidianus sulfidivorans JP7]